MNTLLTRGNAVFAFAFSALSVVSLGCFLTTAFNDYQIDVDVKISKVLLRSGREASALPSTSDLAYLKFGLEADFTPLFNWNTKMMFIYLLAEYSTPTNALSQVVIWDKKMMREDDPVISLDNANTKYYFFDDGKGLKNNQNVTFQLQWNVIPNIGLLPRIRGGRKSLQFPDQYS